jgi:hypothetical protein
MTWVIAVPQIKQGLEVWVEAGSVSKIRSDETHLRSLAPEHGY